MCHVQQLDLKAVSTRGVPKSVQDASLASHTEGSAGRFIYLFLFPYILFMGLLWTPVKASV